MIWLKLVVLDFGRAGRRLPDKTAFSINLSPGCAFCKSWEKWGRMVRPEGFHRSLLRPGAHGCLQWSWKPCSHLDPSDAYTHESAPALRMSFSPYGTPTAYPKMVSVTSKHKWFAHLAHCTDSQFKTHTPQMKETRQCGFHSHWCNNPRVTFPSSTENSLCIIQ